jgi:hypothetical protein
MKVADLSIKLAKADPSDVVAFEIMAGTDADNPDQEIHFVTRTHFPQSDGQYVTLYAGDAQAAKRWVRPSFETVL